MSQLEIAVTPGEVTRRGKSEQTNEQFCDLCLTSNRGEVYQAGCSQGKDKCLVLKTQKRCGPQGPGDVWGRGLCSPPSPVAPPARCPQGLLVVRGVPRAGTRCGLRVHPRSSAWALGLTSPHALPRTHFTISRFPRAAVQSQAGDGKACSPPPPEVLPGRLGGTSPVRRALLAGGQQEAGGRQLIPGAALHEEPARAQAPLGVLVPCGWRCVRLNRISPGQLPNLHARLLHEADAER